MENQTQYNISIIGAGGIGGHLVDLLAPALAHGGLAKAAGGITLHLLDADEVSERNLAHQPFFATDLGALKVEVLATRHASLAAHGLQVLAHTENLRCAEQLEGADLVVVAVDNERTRRLVHRSAPAWLDLRCLGDGAIALHDGADPTFIAQLPTANGSASCQHPEALASGNIQFGFAYAASHGAEWCTQWIRARLGESRARLPPDRMLWLTGLVVPVPANEVVE